MLQEQPGARPKSQRLSHRVQKESAEAHKGSRKMANSASVLATLTNLYPGLNDITDSFEAFPLELIRYFTLLKEIDAKTVQSVPLLITYIKRFLQMSKTHPKREQLLHEIRELIKELMPCLEEKMHVATIAADAVARHVKRIDSDFDLIVENEIPAEIRIGSMDHHPAMIHDTKPADSGKSAQSQRSESRREALAARKAQAGSNGGSGIDASGPGDREEELVKTVRRRANANSTHSAHHSSNNNNNTNSINNNVTHMTNHNMTAVPASQPDERRRGAHKTQPEVRESATRRRPGQNNDLSTEVPSNVKEDNDEEPVYCYCQQVSYGEMLGCDGIDCTREWFHLSCIGLTQPPRGKWYCDECKLKIRKR
ncbi:BA75_04642T0 [Komagataella pastoris]|uniref:Chromatin modification-related protein n=1 Tax=Komagataella pastoris TaxID=4922 RepID=A0A1B2JH91_PICPA|nr:BA75_04642T0 [Komagataella pastoris]